MVNVTTLNITPDLTTGTQRYLHGNVFTKYTALIMFEVVTYFIADTDDEIEFSPTNQPNVGYIESVNGGNIFADFKTGDSIIITNATNPANNGTFSITQKISDSLIRTSNAFGVNEVSSSAKIFLNQTYDSIDFYFNLIENNDTINYLSLTDGSVQKYSFSGMTTSVTHTMAAQGFKSWQLGGATILRVGVDPATSTNYFILTQTFYLSPFFLPTQDISTYPDYFLNNNALKYVFKIDAKPNQSDVTRIQTVENEEEVGNTGWFNENFNTGITNYSISNLQYQRMDDMSVVPSILFSDTVATKVSFNIDNAVDAPFTSSPANEIVLNFINIPQLDSEYKANQNTMDFNFSFDRKKTTLGAGAVAGEFARAIQNYTATYLSASQIFVEFEILLSAPTYARILAMDIKEYLLAIYTKKYSSQTFASDLTTILIDKEEFYVDLGLDGLITEDEFGWIEHPYQDKADAIGALESFTEDEVVAYSRLKLDTSISQFPITISGAEAKIVAKNGSDEFTLKTYNLPFTNKPIVAGVEFIDDSLTASYKAPTGEAILTYSVERDMVADVPPVHYFDIYTPFINRWEYWIKNNAVDADFFDITEPNNGLNNNWEKFDNLAGWGLYHKIEFRVTVNGLSQEFNFYNNFDVLDYNSNVDWDNEDIKTYDVSNNQLINGATEYVLGYDLTKVICEFEYVGGGTAPLINEFEIVMRLEPYENGGEFVSTRISSVRPSSVESQWTQIVGSVVVGKSITGNKYYGTAFIDNNKLQNFTNFAITARIYDLRIIQNGRLFENGDNRLLENNDLRLLENG